MWIAALVVAAVLITWSTLMLAKANPTSRLPMIGRAEHEPSGVVVLRLLGLAVGLVAGSLLAPASQRIAFGIGVLLIMVPTAVISLRHNAGLKAAGNS